MSNSIDIVMNIVDAYKKMQSPPSNTNPSCILMNSSMIVFTASSEFSVSSTLQVPMMGAMDSKAASSTPTLFDLPHSVFKQRPIMIITSVLRRLITWLGNPEVMPRASDRRSLPLPGLTAILKETIQAH
jgi:hypothetical protein